MPTAVRALGDVLPAEKARAFDKRVQSVCLDLMQEFGALSPDAQETIHVEILLAVDGETIHRQVYGETR